MFILSIVHTKDNTFPFVRKLIELAGELRTISGRDVKLTYAALIGLEYHTLLTSAQLGRINVVLQSIVARFMEEAYSVNSIEQLAVLVTT